MWLRSAQRLCKSTAGFIGKYGSRLQSSLAAVTGAKQNKEYNLIETTWSDHVQRTYPYVWLRDNCQCPECYEPSAQSRMRHLKDLDVNVKASEAKVSDGKLNISWSDGHASVFQSAWLKERDFEPSTRAKRGEWRRIPPKTWGTELSDQVPRLDFQKVLSDDEAMYEWLYKLEEYGLVVLENASEENGQTLKLGAKVAHIRKTAYGDLFHVKTRFEPASLAYTPGDLECHSDLCYYEYTPGMQMLHCIAQVATGGENLFVDGFHLANYMRKNMPDKFKILSEIPVDYCLIGSHDYEYHKMFKRPIIQLDDDGEVVRINYNNGVRASFLDLNAGDVKSWYEAMKAWSDLAYRPENQVVNKMKPGDIACFDNIRLLHGRLGYEVKEGDQRTLEGGYIDWDELKSKRRVLGMKLNRREY